MLWIQDLSALDPYYVLPILMTGTMVLQTRMNPTPPDPVQAKVMQIMPFVFSIFFFFFPAGLVLVLAGEQHPFHRAAMADPADVQPRQACPCQAMSLTRDTIAAIATPAGRGGIGVVRVSGPAVARIASTLLGELPRAASCQFGAFRDRHGETVDDGLALYFRAPHSYTGEAGARAARATGDRW
jgi:hypothetical protein